MAEAYSSSVEFLSYFYVSSSVSTGILICTISYNTKLSGYRIMMVLCVADYLNFLIICQLLEGHSLMSATEPRTDSRNT